MPTPTYVTTDESEKQRLSSTIVPKFQHKPDFMASFSARARQGVEDSTSKVLGDILSRPSTGDETKLSITELYNRFPGTHWAEPLTENQALWRWDRNKRRQDIQDDIDKREDGVTSTVAGVGAQILVGALLSPETYIAPAVGRISMVAAKKLAMTPFKPSSLQRVVAQGASKSYFKRGFVEDALLTAVIAEPLYATREQMLENPHTAMDYWTNVALSATLSGTLNSGISRTMDHVQLTSQINHRSEEILEMMSSKQRVLPPEIKAQIKAESRYASAVGQWKAASRFNGEVRVIHEPGIAFTSGIDDVTGNITINTAKIRKSQEIIPALNAGARNPLSSESIPDSKIQMVKDGTLDIAGFTPPTEPVGPQRFPPHPQTKYSGEQGPSVVDTVIQRVQDRIGTSRDMAPGTTHLNAVNAAYSSTDFQITLPKLFTSDTPIVTFKGPVPKVAEGEVFVPPEPAGRAARIAAEAGSISKRVRPIYESGASGIRTAPNSEATRKALSEAGISRRDINRMSPEQLQERMVKNFDDHVAQDTVRFIRQTEADFVWSRTASGGAPEVHGALSGSLEPNGKYNAHGDNLWVKQDVAVAEYANLFHNTLRRHGLSEFLDPKNKGSVEFWSQMERTMAGSNEGLSMEVIESGKVLSEILEDQRIRLNNNGVAIRKLEGYFMRTIHHVPAIDANPRSWRVFMREHLNWDAMGRSNDGPEAIEDYLTAALKDIQNEHVRPGDLLDEVLQGGRKGDTFAHERQFIFNQGRQSEYNEIFGRKNTGREILDQIELRAKAIILTDDMGPDFKKSRTAALVALRESGSSDRQIADAMNHWDEVTGETNTIVDENIAKKGQAWRNMVNSWALWGTGITVAMTDPAANMVMLRSSGLGVSLGASAKHVAESYGDAFRVVFKKNPKLAEEKLMQALLPHDTNLMAMQTALGEVSAGYSGDIPGRLSNFTIKWSGAGIFTRVSQVASLISQQRRLASISSTPWEGLSDDLVRHLERFSINEKEWSGISEFVRGDMLDVFDIPDVKLRNKFNNMLIEGMGVGSLRSSPREAAVFHNVPKLLQLGHKKGEIAREVSDSVTQYLPAAYAVYKRLGMRMAILGGGDARFMTLVDRNHFVESVSMAGIMLGSAIALTSMKDILRNKEPTILGDKPLDPKNMYRVLKVSGIAPIVTELTDTLQGGMAGQMIAKAYRVAESAGDGDFWKTIHQAKGFIPGVEAPVISEVLEAMIGAVSQEYLRDSINRARTVEAISGQAPLIKQ